MLKLRRALVLDAGTAEGPEQSLVVELADRPGERRAAIGDVALLGAAQAGDELIVNVEANDLGLGSGGFDIVHVNLTRGLAASGSKWARENRMPFSASTIGTLPVNAPVRCSAQPRNSISSARAARYRHTAAAAK